MLIDDPGFYRGFFFSLSVPVLIFVGNSTVRTLYFTFQIISYAII